MTDKQLARIKKPSKLITIALADMTKVEEADDMVVDMDDWLVPASMNGSFDTCAVCLAGGVMIYSLGASKKRFIGVGGYESTKQLIALDYLRKGSVSGAISVLYPLTTKEEMSRLRLKFNRHISLYSEPGAQFRSDMEEFQKDLEQAGM